MCGFTPKAFVFHMLPQHSYSRRLTRLAMVARHQWPHHGRLQLSGTFQRWRNAGSGEGNTHTQPSGAASLAHFDIRIQGGGEGSDNGQSQSAAHAALIPVQAVKARENLVVFGIGYAGTVV